MVGCAGNLRARVPIARDGEDHIVVSFQSEKGNVAQIVNSRCVLAERSGEATPKEISQLCFRNNCPCQVSIALPDM